jgi:hypothetical protein
LESCTVPRLLVPSGLSKSTFTLAVVDLWPGLAAALVARIAPVAPDGVEIVEEPPGFLRTRIDDPRWEALAVDRPELEEEIPAEDYDPPYPAASALEALDFVQEFVRNELDVEWPPGSPEPMAALVDDEIRFWFGAEDDPTLTFEPIPLVEVAPAAD